MPHRFFAALAIGVLALAACTGSSSGSATPDPAIAFCPALQAYGTSLAALDALTPSASVAEYKAAVANAKTAYAAAVAVAGPYAGAQLSSIREAQENLEGHANELGSDATPAQAEAALQADYEAVVQQVGLTYNAICNTRPTPSAKP